MDYTQIPRELIYKDRKDLKDFGVHVPGTMNYLLFIQLKQQALLGVPGAREVALKCYNNAYYVCTLILLEADDFPELRISDYVNKLLETEKDYKHIDEVCLASMAMACLLLTKYAPQKYGTDSDIWKKINYRCTHYQWYHSEATTIFHNIMSGRYSPISSLSDTEFSPRDIVEAIEEIGNDNPILLELGIEYIIQEIRKLSNQEQQRECISIAIKDLDGWGGKGRLKSSKRLQELSQELGLEPTPPTEDEEINEVEELEKRLAEKDNIISALKEELEALKEKGKGLTPEQSALFTYALATYLKFNYSNKKEDLGPLASKIFGWGESSMKNKMYSFDKEDANTVALLFEEFDSQFANHIKNIR